MQNIIWNVIELKQQAIVNHAFNMLAINDLAIFNAMTNKRSNKLQQLLGYIRSEQEAFYQPEIASWHILQRNIFYKKIKTSLLR